MAYTTIDDPSAHFQTVLYTGNETARTITNDGNSDLQPDFIWNKGRDHAHYHYLTDTSRGLTKYIYTNAKNAEETFTTYVTGVNSNGFTLGNGQGMNDNTNVGGGVDYVTWQWKANGGTTSSNTSGDINSTVQANTTAGFSIVTYNGNGSSNQTVGHGLGATPDFLLWKNYDTDTSGWDWKVWHTGLTGTNYVRINQTGAQLSSNGDIDALPSSTLFTVGNNGSTNGQSGQNHTIICYAFTSIQGYSKFGSYKGNGNADGPFVYTGFKPAWLLIKNVSSAGNSWVLLDNKRQGFNVENDFLFPNASDAESVNLSNHGFDFLSNGFKNRGTGQNDDGDTFIYMAFAEHPFVSSKGVPTTAR